MQGKVGARARSTDNCDRERAGSPQTIGKQTLVEAAFGSEQVGYPPVQRKASGEGARDGVASASIARRGIEGSGGQLPHRDRIQELFGRHDISGTKSHEGPAAREAAQALGAQAYTFGSSVAFASSPDLHTAAHEATHVVQQRGGVQLKSGIDQPGDAYERHADAVADAVVAGESAEPLLDQLAGRGQHAPAVQRKSPSGSAASASGTALPKSGRSKPDGSAPPDLGNYDSPVGRHVLVLRTWEDTALAARRVELQGRLSRTTDAKARDELLREYEAVEWVASERDLALPKDPAEEAAPQAFMGGKGIKFSVPDNAQGVRAMLEREMAAGTGYSAAREHAQQRIDYSTGSRSATDNDKHQIGHQQMALMDQDAATFRSAFHAEAKRTALSMLDSSTVAIDAALGSYGIADGSFRLTNAAHKVARDPSALDAEVAKWVALSSHAESNQAAFSAGHGHREDLAHTAQELRALQDNIAALAAEQLRLIKLAQSRQREHPSTPASARALDASTLDALTRRPQPLQGATQTPFDQLPKSTSKSPEEQLEFVRAALQARQAQFKVAWVQAEREHPVVAAFRGRKTPDASTLPGVGSDEATTRSVIKQVLPKLGNIYRTKAALQGAWGALDPLQLAPVVELTKQRMFVAQGSYRDRAVHDMVEQAHEKHGSLMQWALEAVLLGLTMVTLIPTAGASGMAALALTGLAYDVYVGLGEYEDFKLGSAAADTDLDKLRSLSDTEPSLTPLLTRILSAGVNITIAGGLFRRAIALRRMAMSGSVDREAVAALNKAGNELGVGGLGDESVAAANGEPGAAIAGKGAGSAGSKPAPQHPPDRTASAPAPREPERSPHAGHEPGASPRPALTPNAGRVTEPVPGLYDTIDPNEAPAGWKLADTGPHRHPDYPELVQVTTEVTAPGGSTGHIQRSYDRRTKTVVMENAFLQKLPSWLHAGMPMVPGKGSPTVTYLTLRQMKLLEVRFGGVKAVKMSTIQNVEAVMQLEYLTRPPHNLPLEQAVAKTHSVLYATTSIEQSGHTIVGVRIDTSNTWKWKLQDMMDYFGTAPERRRELLAKYGLRAEDEALANYDIWIDVTPHPKNP